MFLLYHSDRCNTSETVFHWCYINGMHSTHAVVCWVTTLAIADSIARRARASASKEATGSEAGPSSAQPAPPRNDDHLF
jgi:hypothetical protein